MGPTKAIIEKNAQAELIPEQNRIVEPNTLAVVGITPTPSTVLLEAAQRGASVEMLTKLLELQERWEANEARKAFARDLAAFKAEAPKLEKVKEVDFTSRSGTRVNFKYAPLDYTCEMLSPVLSRHNFSHTWDVDQTNGDKVKVTCLLEHSLGHVKRVSMESAMIDDQRMNALQRLKATVTMLQRYTLESATGTASADVDTEFESAEADNKPFIHAEELEKNAKEIQEAKTPESLKFLWSAAMNKAQEIGDRKAMAHYIKAKDARKKELANAS